MTTAIKDAGEHLFFDHENGSLLDVIAKVSQSIDSSLNSDPYYSNGQPCSSNVVEALFAVADAINRVATAIDHHQP